MSTPVAIALAIVLLPAIIGWVIAGVHLRHWWLERRHDRMLDADIARYNAELVSLAAVKWSRAKRGRVLKLVSRGSRAA